MHLLPAIELDDNEILREAASYLDGQPPLEVLEPAGQALAVLFSTVLGKPLADRIAEVAPPLLGLFAAGLHLWPEMLPPNMQNEQRRGTWILQHLPQLLERFRIDPSSFPPGLFPPPDAPMEP